MPQRDRNRERGLTFGINYHKVELISFKLRQFCMRMTIAPQDLSLLTDLYQITMSACYVGEGLESRSASFELFARRLPKDFGYLIAMGLEQALSYLEALRVTPEQIEQLQGTGLFDHVSDRFWEMLEGARFEGSVWAVPEGTAVFANEPLLRIEAPLWQAQWVETYLLNVLNYQTLIATRAARMRDVAGDGVKLYEFGTRRAFGPQAAVWAARASMAAGFDATSNVLAALELGRVPVGTMAHSLVMAIGAVEGGEDRAFEAFHRYFPGAPLLIDTYDTIAAAKRLAAKRLAANLPANLAGVRIDSGDVGAQSRQIRGLLPDVAIVASGDMDEYRIQELNNEEACIDGFGIGTQLVTGSPVNGVYKLVEIDGIPVMKDAPGKRTYPGRKQIFRSFENGKMTARLGLAHEEKPGDIGLLKPMMESGKRLWATELLETISARTRRSVLELPAAVRSIVSTGMEVEISDALMELQAGCMRS
jgi:nicotinate phosphoribosyltransferase